MLISVTLHMQRIEMVPILPDWLSCNFIICDIKHASSTACKLYWELLTFAPRCIPRIYRFKWNCIIVVPNYRPFRFQTLARTLSFWRFLMYTLDRSYVYRSSTFGIPKVVDTSLPIWVIPSPSSYIHGYLTKDRFDCVFNVLHNCKPQHLIDIAVASLFLTEFLTFLLVVMKAPYVFRNQKRTPSLYRFNSS